jgi:hypothetical protein
LLSVAVLAALGVSLLKMVVLLLTHDAFLDSSVAEISNG